MCRNFTLLLIVGIFLGGTPSAFCENVPQSSSSNTEIQDTKKAAEYFKNEINFNTNPSGVKAVVEGRVKNVTIVDIRRAKDFAEGHIPGAINLPFDEYHKFEGNETQFPGLRKDGFNYVYFYHSLCDAPQKAAYQFTSHGYPTKIVIGGFEEWKKNNYPIVK